MHALGAALEEENTGRMLWSRAADTKRPIGSLTKVMTALVVLRAGGLNRELTVSQAAVSYARQNDGSSAGLHAGDKLTTQQLLEAMLVPSGCDAAYVLASAYGPGLPAVVAKMNALARQLGLRSHALRQRRRAATAGGVLHLLDPAESARHRPGRDGRPAVPLHRGRAPDLPARPDPGTTPTSGTPPTS